MHATSIPHASQYYPQPNYTFYTSSDRYCAYDPVSGNHFIHSLNDNRWYPYLPTESSPGVQQKTKRYYAPFEYRTYDCCQMRETVYRDGGDGGRFDRGRDRQQRKQFLYTTADVESARRSLIEEEIGMDYVYEEDLNSYGGADWWNSADFQHSRKTRGQKTEEPSHIRHRHRSAPEISTRYQHYSQAQRQHDPRDEHRAQDEPYHSQLRRKSRHYIHSSNKAHVGGPGSDHDSGYFEDFEPPNHPRNAMPGIAKWLDSLEDGTVNGDFPSHSGAQFLHSNSPYGAEDDHLSRSRAGPRKPMKERSYNSQPARPEDRDGPTINIEINLEMDDMDYEMQQHQASAKQHRNRHRHPVYEERENIVYHNGEEYDYYYEIPAPPPPPRTDRVGRTPAKPTTVYQPNSIYSGPESVNFPMYTPGLPRAPSPPPSPAPHRRRASGGERIRYVRGEPRVRERRTW